eukprot:3584424-Prymnesium_polylepis.2
MHQSVGCVVRVVRVARVCNASDACDPCMSLRVRAGLWMGRDGWRGVLGVGVGVLAWGVSPVGFCGAGLVCVVQCALSVLVAGLGEGHAADQGDPWRGRPLRRA